jgi:transcriptional regulator with XRE-family HTH domain
MARRRQDASPHIASIGGRLRRLRKERRLTQSELARQIGIQQSDLSRMEKGEYRVSLDNLFKILNVFDVEVTEFFEGREVRPTASPQALTHQDMQILQLLRQLSPQGRLEAQEYIEFKLRREQIERRVTANERNAEEGS